MKTWALRQLRESAGRYAASVAVVAIVSAFAVILIESVDVLGRALNAAGLDGVEAIQTALSSVTLVFLGIAVVVAAIVISNSFAMVYLGRLKDIALLRLVGATSKQIRRTALLDGVAVGVVGSVIGIVGGSLLCVAAIALLNSTYDLDLSFGVVPQLVLAPLLGSILTTTIAAFIGARRASGIAPVEAGRLAGGGEQLPERAAKARIIVGLVLVGLGAAFLLLGLVVGAVTPLGVLIAFGGGVLSITGIVIGAPAFLPPAVTLATRLLPRNAAARLGGSNLRHHPVRTARTLLAIVIGVTLITMFTVAGQMFETSVTKELGDQAAEFADGLNALLTGVYALTSFSVLVAAIGVGSTLSMSVLQRRRELGVLRAVGLTTRQARGMLLAESLLLALVGVVLGLLLGTVYGFVGANATLGVQGFLAPELPLPFAAIVLGGALVFGAAASLAPGARASRVPPAEALRAA